jgi:hypothetical protein
LAAVACLAIGFAGCDDEGEDSADTEAAQTTVAAASATTASASASATTATVENELLGDWETSISAGDDVTLTIRATRYGIRRGGASGSGAIRVGDGEIEFYGSDLCDGTGVYAWSLDGDSLTFEETGEDPCTGRSEVLAGITYTRK